MEKQTKLYQKWWFWVCIILTIFIICVISIIFSLINKKSIIVNANLDKKITIGKLTYYIDNNWKYKESLEENTIYKYHYPSSNTMLMVMIENDTIYKATDNVSIILNDYIQGLNIADNDFIGKDTKKIGNYNCGIVKCYLNGYETIQYIILNNNEVYIFGFGQKNKLNSKNINIIEDIIKNAEIIIETEEEKQTRLQKEAEEKSKKEIEEKAKKEQEKQNFIASCKTYTYEQIARNPEKFKGTNVKLIGEVIQVVYDSDSVDLRVNITKKGTYSTWYTDTVYITYNIEKGEDKILEDDIITIYGVSMGDYTYKSTMGASVTLPLINGKYININN